jgi:hypothetical protein
MYKAECIILLTVLEAFPNQRMLHCRRIQFDSLTGYWMKKANHHEGPAETRHTFALIINYSASPQMYMYLPRSRVLWITRILVPFVTERYRCVRDPHTQRHLSVAKGNRLRFTNFQWGNKIHLGGLIFALCIPMTFFSREHFWTRL